VPDCYAEVFCDSLPARELNPRKDVMLAIRHQQNVGSTRSAR
jgi:hypothetical protein